MHVGKTTNHRAILCNNGLLNIPGFVNIIILKWCNHTMS